MKGGAPRAVWSTSGTDPRTVSLLSLARNLAQAKRAPHLIWSPHTGEIVQLVPITRAGRMLEGSVGREGRVCVQIMVIGDARRPFTDAPLKGLERIMTWLDSWGVPRRWPAGPPLSSPQAFHSPRDRRQWARGGHFGHSQAPESVSADPGGIDIRRITGPQTPVAEIPRPRRPPGPGVGATPLASHRLNPSAPAHGAASEAAPSAIPEPTRSLS